MQTLTKLRTSYLAFAAASAFGLLIGAAPATADQDGYVDEPGYAQQANDQAYDDVASDEAMDESTADDEDTAMDDSEDADDTDTAADDSEDADDSEMAADDGDIETVEVTATPPRIERGS